jgi:hypothetical protein
MQFPKQVERDTSILKSIDAEIKKINYRSNLCLTEDKASA